MMCMYACMMCVFGVAGGDMWAASVGCTRVALSFTVVLVTLHTSRVHCELGNQRVTSAGDVYVCMYVYGA